MKWNEILQFEKVECGSRGIWLDFKILIYYAGEIFIVRTDEKKIFFIDAGKNFQKSNT